MSKLLSGRSILIVEDEALILMMIADMLGDLGCKSMQIATNIGQAITLIESRIPDAAMLDLNLNGTESYPIADALKAHGVPYFFTTGNSLTSLKDGYTDRHILSKPFTFEQLATMLLRSLDSTASSTPPRAA